MSNAAEGEQKREIVPAQEAVQRHIHTVRGQNVMPDSDLAELYRVQTGDLNQAVKRNIDRFPPDFLFTLTEQEYQTLLSQSVITNKGRGGRRRSYPNAFTEQGIAMLSSVLRSERAVQVNIAIMRAFVQTWRLSLTHQELAWKLTRLEKNYHAQFQVVFDALRRLMEAPAPPERRMGFREDTKEAR